MTPILIRCWALGCAEATDEKFCPRHREGRLPRLITSVIESEVPRGTGAADDPERVVTQYHTADGQLLAERDDVGALVPRFTLREIFGIARQAGYLREAADAFSARGFTWPPEWTAPDA